MPYRSPRTPAETPAHEGVEELLTVAEVAILWGASQATVDRERRAGNLRAVKKGQGYLYERAEAMKVGEIRKAPAAAVQREQHEGDRDARVFEAFEEGLNVTGVVVREHVAVPIVMRLYEVWEQSRKRARTVCLHEHNGGDCDGPPQSGIGLCNHHAARSRILRDEEALVLRGETVPVALHCQACGIMAPRGVCSTCMAAVTVLVEGEGQGRRLVVRAGQRVVAIVAAERARELARQLLERKGDEAPSAETPNAENVMERPVAETPPATAMRSALGPTPSVDEIRKLITNLEGKQ
jgi:hypothetical protein